MPTGLYNFLDTMRHPKTAVVTGAAKGLGKEIVLWLSKKGYNCVVHYHKSKIEAGELVEAVKQKGVESFAFGAGITNEKEVDALFEATIKKFGRVDLLVNNVGNFIYKDFNKTTNSEFRDMVESNIYSALYASRAVLPFMRKEKYGQIINIGAVGADRILIRAKSTPYFIGKNGVYALTKIMAWEEAKNGIRINMVSPASLVEDIFKASEFPMGRSARYSDVLKAIEFLISDENSYINGENLEVAGATITGMEK